MITTVIPTGLPSRRLCLDTGMLPPARCVELLREYAGLIEES
ncbi:hypothetical protein [Provencibacterium massiliense]|nr:hypothetical protein [Provencibacterium massiliense]